mgnify:CR=1 FL=1
MLIQVLRISVFTALQYSCVIYQNLHVEFHFELITGEGIYPLQPHSIIGLKSYKHMIMTGFNLIN